MSSRVQPVLDTPGKPLIEFLGLEEQTHMASVLVVAYRHVSVETCESLLGLVGSGNWHVAFRSGDAWIGRARSVIASQWYRESPDEVFVMIDADIVFQAADIQRLARACRPGYEIVCADYPVHNGQFMAGTTLDPPLMQRGLVEMERVAAGCMAVHRSALDALVKHLPLCHASLPIASYWPFFIPFLSQYNNDTFPMSEDFAFTDLVRKEGMRAWRHPWIKVAHLSEFLVDADNMHQLHAAGGLTW